MPDLIPDCRNSHTMIAARAWDTLNPHIWELIVQEADAVKAMGFTHYGIATIWEYLRHKSNLTTRSNIEAEDFKMPANHCSYFARKYNLNFPQEPKFMTERHLRSTGPIKMDRYGREIDDDDDWVQH